MLIISLRLARLNEEMRSSEGGFDNASMCLMCAVTVKQDQKPKNS